MGNQKDYIIAAASFAFTEMVLSTFTPLGIQQQFIKRLQNPKESWFFASLNQNPQIWVESLVCKKYNKPFLYSRTKKDKSLLQVNYKDLLVEY